MAILKSEDRTQAVRTISVPTPVLHGEDDSLIPLPHGEYTTSLISGAKLAILEIIRHNMPDAVMPLILGNMIQHLKTVDRAQSSGVYATQTSPD